MSLEASGGEGNSNQSEASTRGTGRANVGLFFQGVSSRSSGVSLFRKTSFPYIDCGFLPFLWPELSICDFELVGISMVVREKMKKTLSLIVGGMN